MEAVHGLDNRDSETVLSATEITRDFETSEGKLPVLAGITFSVKRGEMVAVTGASGVGKSTLLHILGGLDRPTKGEVRLGNRILNEQSEKEMALFRNEKIGFVFQHHYLLDDFTALENVMIPQLLAGASHAEAQDKAEQMLSEVGLTNRTSHRPGELSGGEQQRVAVARALVNKPEVLLADEPSGNLDTETGSRLHNLLRNLASEHNACLVIATHNRELAGLCDRELGLLSGRIVR